MRELQDLVADLERPVLRRCRPRREAFEAAAAVVAAGGMRAAIGVVLGTGMGGLVDRLDGAWTMSGVETG